MHADNTLATIFTTLYQRQQLRGRTANAVRLHLLSLRHFARYLGRFPLLDDLTDDTVAGLMDWMVSVRKTSARSANRVRDSILAQWRFYARKGLVPVWPDVAPLPEPERVPVAWTREELRRIFSEVRLLTGRVDSVPASLWWESLLVVLWDTGERIFAVSRLEWQWVDLASGWVTYRAEIRKGKTRDIKRRLHPLSIAILRAMHFSQGSPRHGRIWGDQSFRTGIVYFRYKKILEAAKLPQDRQRMFHCIRRSAASHLEAAGGDATDFLDHSDRRTTRKSYLDPTIVGPRPAADLLFRPDEEEEEDDNSAALSL